MSESEHEYAELHAHTNFSLLDGTSDPEKMVEHAVQLGLRALAITDHDSISGVVRFAAEAKRRDLQAIMGAELTLDTPAGAAHTVLLAQDLSGYHNLCALLTEAYRQGGRDRPAVSFDALAARGRGWSSSPAAPGASSPAPCAPGGQAPPARWPGATATPSAPSATSWK